MARKPKAPAAQPMPAARQAETQASYRAVAGGMGASAAGERGAIGAPGAAGGGIPGMGTGLPGMGGLAQAGGASVPAAAALGFALKKAFGG